MNFQINFLRKFPLLHSSTNKLRNTFDFTKILCTYSYSPPELYISKTSVATSMRSKRRRKKAGYSRQNQRFTDTHGQGTRREEAPELYIYGSYCLYARGDPGGRLSCPFASSLCIGGGGRACARSQ